MRRAPTIKERAIFDAYIAGGTYTSVGAQFGRTARTVYHTIRRVGGRDGRWSVIARKAREEATQDRVFKIAVAATAAFGLAPGKIWTATRTQSVVRARHAVFAFAIECGVSSMAVGRAFEMDHGTVLHGRNQAVQLRAHDADFAAAYNEMAGAAA